MFTQKFKEVDGIKVFHDNIEENHDDYNAQGLDKLYAQEEKHFWFISRKEYILQSMKKYISFNEKIIEIGAGTGNVSRFLKKNGYKNISVGEMHLSGLKYAQGYNIGDCYQFNLLTSPFEDEFNTICMFDVLEHIEDDVLALKNVHNSLTNNGKIVLTVPSHMWLWNKDDTMAGHKTRYTKKILVKKLEENGFQVLNSRYFFISIIPLLYLRTIFNKDKTLKNEKEVYNIDLSMNPIVSKSLLILSRIENKINWLLPNLFGGSLFIIARKQ